MENFLSYTFRVIAIFFFTYLSARALSKKAIAEMTSYEMAGIILLSTVAAEPLVTKVTTKALWGTGLLVFLIFLTSRLSLIQRLTPILEHTPTVVIKNGQLDMNALKHNTLSINQLMGLLRQKGYDKVTDVEYAIFEPQGNLSAFPKSQNRPLQPSDLNIATKYEGLTIPLIIDGSIMDKNLAHVNLDETWLLYELSKKGINDYKNQVSLAQLDTQGNLLVSRTNK